MLIVVVAFPIVAAGIWLINYALPYLWHALFAHHVLHNPVHMPYNLAWLGTYLSGFPWQPLVIGILAGLVPKVIIKFRNATGEGTPIVLRQGLK